jgi:hypothetical protein
MIQRCEHLVLGLASAPCDLCTLVHVNRRGLVRHDLFLRHDSLEDTFGDGSSMHA